LGKPSGGSKNPAEKRRPRSRALAQRECLPLHDVTDCLLDVYSDVANRAYQKYLERGEGQGSELEDWVSAERELLKSMPIDLSDSRECIHALASVSGFASAEIWVGIEPRWLLIRACHANDLSESDSAETEAPKTAFAAVNAEAGEMSGGGDALRDGRDDPQPHRGRASSPRQAGCPKRADIQVRTPNIREQATASRESRPANPTNPREPSADQAHSGRGSLFSLHELPANVDPARSLVVLANGILGIRMPKARD
jgi:HSP20 family molecular chaperone IbpA